MPSDAFTITWLFLVAWQYIINIWIELRSPRGLAPLACDGVRRLEFCQAAVVILFIGGSVLQPFGLYIMHYTSKLNYLSLVMMIL